MNPLFIAHRINTQEELAKVPVEYGIELDVRDSGEHLIVQHDPFKEGERLDRFLEQYRHRFIIFNVKSERIEWRIKELIPSFKVTDYFFLDSSFPMIFNLSQAGEPNLALRYSEYEGLDTILAMKGKVRWVWIDCFTQLPINANSYRILKDAGFKLCLVSPELQMRDHDIEPYARKLREQRIEMDAICTKIYNIPRWLLELG